MDESQCKLCGQEPGQKYCGGCRVIYCDDCWTLPRLHRQNDPRHPIYPVPLPVHPVLSDQERKMYEGIVDPRLTDEQRQQQHEEDMLNLWFSVDCGDNGQLQLEEFPQFRYLVDRHLEKNTGQSPCYTQLVSFIGDTGAGKSTMIRLLMQRPWDNKHLGETERLSFGFPIAGAPGCTLSTSGGVHLYAAPNTDTNRQWRLLLYADCEGFRGGSQLPIALKEKQRALKELNEANKSKTSSYIRWISDVLSFLRGTRKRTLSLNGGREDAVRELFPRLLYNFSDVVVHAIEAPRTLESHLAKLVEWAQNSKETAVNRVVLPHLIVVLSLCPDTTSQVWDPVKTTSEILNDHLETLETNKIFRKYSRMLNQLLNTTITTLGGLLQHCYSSVTFIRIPDARHQTLFSTQLQSLESLIHEATGKAERAKSEAACFLTSEIQSRMFTMAFDHYKDNLERPFDFLESLLSISTLDGSLSSCLFVLLKAAHSAYQTSALGTSGSDFCSTITPVLCSTIALDCRRSTVNYPATLSDLYRGRTMNSGDVKGTSNVAATYQAQVAKAVNDFLDLACQCDFIGVDGTKCGNLRLAHKSFQHQSARGKFIGFGTFESKFVDDLWMCWNKEIDETLRELDERHGKSDALVRPGEQCNAELQVTWSIHCQNLRTLYHIIPNLNIRNIKACSWCLRDKPLQSLQCKHQICWGCAELVGDSQFESGGEMLVAIRSCGFHQDVIHFERSNYVTNRL